MQNSSITRAILRDGSARIIFSDTTAIVDTAHTIHSTSKTMTAVLGRTLTAASLMGSLLKNKTDSLTLRISGDGPCGNVVCVSDYKGNVRGYADDMSVELLPNVSGKLDVGGAVGKCGNLYVIKDQGMTEPYIGISPIVTGEIGDDITRYFAESEQTPTVCALGVRVDTEINCVGAGGFLIQLMPGAEDDTVSKIEANMKLIPSPSAMIASGKGAEDIIAAAMSGLEYDIFDSFDIEYKCTCSRDKYLRALIGLPDSDVKELQDSGEPIETSCHFCGKKYVFDPSEIVREN